MTILYIVTAFVCGFYLGGKLVAAHIKSAFKMIDNAIEAAFGNHEDETEN